MPEARSSQSMRTVVESDREAWDASVNALGGHPLQLWGWGASKADGGRWAAHRVRVLRADGSVAGLAQVLERHLPWPWRALSYIPRGPVLADFDERDAVVQALATWCRANVGGIGMTIEPEWPAGTEVPGVRQAPETYLLPSTLVLDLTQSEDQLLADMVKKTRQYVHKAGREALEYRAVTTDAEIEACLDVYEDTAERAGFPLHHRDYYRTVRRELGPASPVFAAFDGDQPVAFLWLAVSATTSFELYGGMDATGQRLRANYALKWYAIEQVKAAGVTRYDLNGLLNDGISTFKRGFAHHEDTFVGTLDVPFSGFLYTTWNKARPAAIAVLRRVSRR